MNCDFSTECRALPLTEANQRVARLDQLEELPGSFDIRETKAGFEVVCSEGSELPFKAVRGEGRDADKDDGTVTIFRDGSRAYIHTDQVRFIEA